MRRRDRGATWLLVLATGLCVVVWIDQGRVAERLQNLPDQGPEDETMQERTTTWTSSEGEEAVRTVRKDDESLEDFLTRHKDAVVAAQVISPKI